MKQFKHYICMSNAVQDEETHLFGFTLVFARLWTHRHNGKSLFQTLVFKLFVTKTKNSNSYIAQ